MAKKSCAKTRISFKTKRGKTVSFTGRKGGDSAYGGSCPAKRKPVSKWAHLVGNAGRACSGMGKVGSPRRSACLKQQIKMLSR